MLPELLLLTAHAHAFTKWQCWQCKLTKYSVYNS